MEVAFSFGLIEVHLSGRHFGIIEVRVFTPEFSINFGNFSPILTDPYWVVAFRIDIYNLLDMSIARIGMVVLFSKLLQRLSIAEQPVDLVDVLCRLMPVCYLEVAVTVSQFVDVHEARFSQSLFDLIEAHVSSLNFWGLGLQRRPRPLS